ncbi:MAG: ABC-type transport auxiliary lipoprotein family protein [Gammaproteobacteria bacterium]|nr:ABC-type transport auxiliary lipoprotein family protein [Gammaproteobacteria bacterium]
MHRHKVIGIALCLSIALPSLAGCGLLPERDTAIISNYTIAPEIGTQTAAARCEQVLRMRNVAVDPPWATSDMLYSRTEHQISSFAYHRWSASPATLLGNALTEALQGSGLYRGVLGPTDPGSSDLILAVSLDKGPIQVFPPKGANAKGEPASSHEVMTLSAALIDAVSGKLLANHSFRDTQAAAPNPYGGVVAANAIAGRLIGRIMDWLAQGNAAIAACKGN